MKAMVLEQVGAPLRAIEKEVRAPGPGEALVRVRACGVCRTDLHICDGDLEEPTLPLVPGHQIVGVVEALGDARRSPADDRDARDLEIGDRVGIPWLAGTCEACGYCRSGRENLCDDARFTGYQRDGGYAEYVIADAGYCLPIPESYRDAEAAPLLCAGLIGHRALCMAGDGTRLGLYGFGASAHIVAQLAISQGRSVSAFTRPGDIEGQAFAREMGAEWAGGSDEIPEPPLDAAIIFAPVGPLVPTALRAIAKGGVVVCAGIHMTDIPSFAYELLWGERSIRSVANLTRRDGRDFFERAPRIPIRTEVETFALTDANEALERLRQGRIRGAAVLTVP